MRQRREIESREGAGEGIIQRVTLSKDPKEVGIWTCMESVLGRELQTKIQRWTGPACLRSARRPAEPLPATLVSLCLWAGAAPE